MMEELPHADYCDSWLGKACDCTRSRSVEAKPAVPRRLPANPDARPIETIRSL
jgi:hypothetical protein